MYPFDYFSLFPPVPRIPQVFVAMSFSNEFIYRWENVIAPAVSKIEVKGEKLTAHRVDFKAVSDSILTEIMNGIAQSRLIIADITTIGEVTGAPIRNANVLYEVGLAQAVRLPEEVLLFRSDNDPLLFDVTNIRINTYNPDEDPDKAIEVVTKAILSTLQEVEFKRSLTVRRLAESLDYSSWWALCQAFENTSISQPEARTIGQIIGSLSTSNAISKLLEVGALKTQFKKMSPELLESEGDNQSASALMQYDITELGKAVYHYCCDELGLFDNDMAKYL